MNTVTNASTNASPDRLTDPSISSQFASPQQVIQKILHFGKITPIERHWLLQAGISELQLSEAELAQIRLIHDRLRMGLIKVVDC